MRKQSILISIIIPLPGFNNYIRESIRHYEKLNEKGFEIIILPDFKEEETLSKKLKTTIIPSGKVGPAEKRDLGAKYAKGKILAFIDDDAYPDKNWLKNALALFGDPKVGAVGGPAITPPDEPFWRKISGNIYSSFLMSGHYRKRYVKTGKPHEDYDIPSVNLLVRKDIFNKIGGFDSTFYPGEDTKLCLEIKKLGYRIIYSPDVLVYHHRRPLIPNHFKQIANYALHRGFFVKKFPETSFKLPYFLPSIFTIGLITGILLSIYIPTAKLIYTGAIILYFLGCIFSSLSINLFETIFTAIGIFLSHLTYGIFFIKGLIFTKELKR